MPWSKNMKLIDANVILRYLLNDIPDMARKANAIIENGAYTKPEIIAAVVYVLKGVYQATREDIRVYIKEALRYIQCVDRPAILYAIDLYADISLDFVDCLLIAYHDLNNESVFTFDKKLNRHLNTLNGSRGKQ